MGWQKREANDFHAKRVMKEQVCEHCHERNAVTCARRWHYPDDDYDDDDWRDDFSAYTIIWVCMPCLKLLREDDGGEHAAE